MLCPGTEVQSGKTRRERDPEDREDSGNSPVIAVLIIPCQCRPIAFTKQFHSHPNFGHHISLVKWGEMIVIPSFTDEGRSERLVG